jgi:hypothetical protein
MTANNSYFNRQLSQNTSIVQNPDNVIIPAWALVSFFEDYEVDELLIQPDLTNDGIKIIMMKDGKRLSTKNPKLNNNGIY